MAKLVELSGTQEWDEVGAEAAVVVMSAAEFELACAATCTLPPESKGPIGGRRGRARKAK